jgi:hypothetical protein
MRHFSSFLKVMITPKYLEIIVHTHVEREREQTCTTCGLYYKPMTSVNDDSRVMSKLETSLTDDARVVIYDHHMFIVQATGHCKH